MKNLIKAKKGFTLIELVIVIAILGILAGIAIPRFLDATATARGAKIVSDLRTIDSAIVIYATKTGKEPTVAAQLTTSVSGDSPTSFQLLASWPKPASGSVVFPAKPGVTVTIANTLAYTISNGRGVLGTNTATDLAEVGGGYSEAAETPAGE